MAYGTLKADVIQSDTAGTPPQFNDGNSTQIGTLCRAWVNFNGTGTVAIRASFNVSSITDNGSGDYTVNFTTALPDANYSAVTTSRRYQSATASSDTAANDNYSRPNAYATSSVSVFTMSITGRVGVDADAVNVAIFR